jgi:hypothetical protein
MFKTIKTRNASQDEKPTSRPYCLTPTCFRNTHHQALYAGFSRLTSCVVNEGLAEGRLLYGAIVSTHPGRCWCWVRAPVTSSTNIKTNMDVGANGVSNVPTMVAGDFLVALRHQPIFEHGVDGVKRVLFLHPEDIDVDAYLVLDNYESTDMTDAILLNNDIEKVHELMFRLG